MVLRRIIGGWDKAGGRAVALAMTAAAGLAACSSTPKYVNPVELYRSAAGFTLNDDTTGERNAQNLEAGRNQPYPNLGTVPPPPDRAMSSIDRQKLQQGLSDDRAQAKQSDADLRASRGAAASGAPTPITRPSSTTDGAAPTETKRNADQALASGHSDVSSTRRRSPSGSEPAPQETALNSPTTYALPEGDTPRPAPPPPSLPPPEKARKPAAGQAAKSPPAATAKHPSPAPQTAAADPQRPAAPSTNAGSPHSPSPAVAAKAGTAPAAVPTPPAAPSTAPADQAVRIPPPPPADMMMPAPDQMAAAEPARPASPPAVAAPVDAPKAAPSAAPTADTAVPSAPWPPPLGPSDTQKSPSEQTATLDSVRPRQQSLTTVPAPTAAIPPEQQAALTPPPQVPRAQEPEPATAAPPPRTGRLGSVSMQAAEIKFAGNGLALTPDDDRRLADVVKLYDKHGGVVRVVGYGRRGYGADAAQQELASFSKAIERANVVAKALTELGLASNRIVVQAAPIGDGLGEDRAEVLLEF